LFPVSSIMFFRVCTPAVYVFVSAFTLTTDTCRALVGVAPRPRRHRPKAKNADKNSGCDLELSQYLTEHQHSV
jgi:hypothetical protein